jgi:hypothetical protein
MDATLEITKQLSLAQSMANQKKFNHPLESEILSTNKSKLKSWLISVFLS